MNKEKKPVRKFVCCFTGGLAEEVDEKVLHAAFIPFGDITDIQIPLDYETGQIQRFSLTLICLNRWM